MESGFSSRTFSGVRFALVGFNPVDDGKLRSKLLSGGGLDVGQYSENYTHLIVDRLVHVYDDPVCVAARNSGKVVVTGSWVDHSFDIGMLIDANSVLYRPLKDLNGIPGSKSLFVCLTGYQGQDREDIMTMVGLMGGQFSKPLVANRVTHLICYKFEGEKYELAKRMKKIKLVNHRWLEDCLKNWKLLPEVDYEISGHELELMEASARDSEDEAEDASVKRANTSPLGLRVGTVATVEMKHANTSPLGLRVGTMAAVEMSKSGGEDIPVIQTNSGAQAVSSFCNTSKEKWLSPKKANLSLEAIVSADAVTPLQHHYQRTSTFQGTSSYASTIPVNKTSEQGMSRMASDDSTSTKRSMGNTYSRKTLKRSPDTTELGDGSSGHYGFSRMDDGGTKASASNISTSKSGSAIKRARLLEDFDKIDKFHDEMSPQTKLTDRSMCSKSLEKVNHIDDASIALPASLIVKELELSLPKNLVPVPSINDPTESGEVSHKSPASVLGAELLSSNVVNIEDAIPSVAPTKADIWTLENMGLKEASDKIPQISVTESDLFGVKYKPETELPKKKTAPRKSLGTRGRKKSTSLQKGSIYLSEPIPKDELTDCLNKVNAATPVTENDNPEISIHVLNSETVPEKGKYIVSDFEAPMRTEAADKQVDQDKRMGMSLNQDKLMDEAPKAEKHDAAEDIIMLEIELNDGLTKDPSHAAIQLEDDKNKRKCREEGIVEKNSFQSKKKGSSSTAKAGNRRVKVTKKSKKEHEDKENGTAEKDFWDNYAEEENVAVNDKSGKVSSGKEHSPVVGKQLTRDEATKDPNDSSMPLEVDQNKLKRRKEATLEKNNLQSGKKGSSSTVDRANGTAEKDSWDMYTEEKENVAVNDKSGKVSSGGEHSPVVGKQLTRKEAATKDPSDSSMQLEVDQNKLNRRKKAIVEKNSLQSGKKGSSSTADRANGTAEKDSWGNYAEEKENVAVDDKSGKVSSGEKHIPVAEKKRLSRKKAASKNPSDSSMLLEADKNKLKRTKEATVKKNSLQRGNKGSSSTVEVKKPVVKKTKKSKQEHDDKANETVMKDREDHPAEDIESDPVATKYGKVSSGADQIPVTEKPLATKKATKSAKMQSKADKVSRQQISSKSMASRKVLQDQEQEPKCFIVSGPRPQRKEYLQIIKRLNGKCCRDSHQWSYQATHFIATNICRTEKFFAATASGSWILKTDYIADSKEAGKLLPEEPYEWHSSGLNADGAISLEAPRKWRLVREKTGHGALNGLSIVVYGDCFVPSLDTLKRAVKAGDGTVLATAPPYTRFLNENTDFAVISPGMPRVDIWIQEFIRHEIPCVLADYLVEYVCKPGYALDKHVLYNTNSWAERSFNKLQHNMIQEVADKDDDAPAASSSSGCSDEEDDVACEVCGSGERGEVMLICGNEEGSSGCGIGAHIDCCDPPLTQVPQHDWFCSKCSVVTVKPPNKRKKGKY